MVCLAVLAGPAGATDPFEVHVLESEGRTVAAEIADFDGDGRGDIMQIVIAGLPPAEQRTIRVFHQRADGSFPSAPAMEIPLPAGSAAYDLADVDPAPGTELILLRRRGLTILSLAGSEARQRDVLVADGPTLGAVEDERGIDRLKLAWDELGSPPWLLVPQLSEVAVLSGSGELMGRPQVGARANYFVQPRPGPLMVESDIQLFLDVPRLSVGDVNGDGSPDIVSSGRHEIRVFLRRADGSFASVADRSLPLGRVSALDHARTMGVVRVSAADLDGDERLDVLISHLSGGLQNARFTTSVHLNRGGEWNLDEPDQVFESKGWGTDELVDLDGDGRLELVRVVFPLGIFELIEALVTRSLDAQVAVYRATEQMGFAVDPWLKLKLGLPLSFERGRPRGFVPNVQADLNGDGYRDLLTSSSGRRIEVYLGGSPDAYRERVARQALDTDGRIRFGDLEGDGMADFVLYNPRDLDAELRLVRNLGVLPGSLPRMGAPRAER